ncbi:MAG: hypothetical protein P8075_09760 [Deltaproteobacteria bacterium]|jgi:hypothetical protein
MNSRLGVTATPDMAVLLSEPEAWRSRASLRQAPRDCARDRQDKLTLRRTVQVRLGTNPAAARDGCQVARPSPWSRDGNS